MNEKKHMENALLYFIHLDNILLSSQWSAAPFTGIMRAIPHP